MKNPKYCKICFDKTDKPKVYAKNTGNSTLMCHLKSKHPELPELEDAAGMIPTTSGVAIKLMTPEESAKIDRKLTHLVVCRKEPL